MINWVAQSGGNAVDTSAEGGTVMRGKKAASGSVSGNQSLPLPSLLALVHTS